MTRPTLTNRYSLPRPLVRALERDPYNAGECEMSVSRLVQPPRKVELERQHQSELVEDASERLYALYGQIGHTILERAAQVDPGEKVSIVERRFFADCLGWRISGQADLIEEENQWFICDYKFTSVWSIKDGHKEEWQWQLRILRWLAEKNGVRIDGLQNVVMFRDWRPSEQKRYTWYPPKVLILPLEMSSIQKDQALTEERVREHQSARKILPECSDEDRWLRNGEYKRCLEYCSAFPFCVQSNATLTEVPF